MIAGFTFRRVAFTVVNAGMFLFSSSAFAADPACDFNPKPDEKQTIEGISGVTGNNLVVSCDRTKSIETKLCFYNDSNNPTPTGCPAGVNSGNVTFDQLFKALNGAAVNAGVKRNRNAGNCGRESLVQEMTNKVNKACGAGNASYLCNGTQGKAQVPFYSYKDDKTACELGQVYLDCAASVIRIAVRHGCVGNIPVDDDNVGCLVDPDNCLPNSDGTMFCLTTEEPFTEDELIEDSPTAEPTVSLTPEPTPFPSVEPTVTPTVEATPEPIYQWTTTPTPVPSPYASTPFISSRVDAINYLKR